MKAVDVLLVPVAWVWAFQMFSWNTPVNPGLLGVANGLFLLWLLAEVRAPLKVCFHPRRSMWSIGSDRQFWRCPDCGAKGEVGR